MASATLTLCFPMKSPRRPLTLLRSSIPASSRGFVQLNPFPSMTKSLNLSSNFNISRFQSLLPQNLCTIPPLRQNSTSFSPIVATKGYKMKTHKASAKRFRVTGTGKIVRRRAGKQHLNAKKTKKRKLRLSKMHPVNRSDYDNVVGALPYLKVNRQAK